MVQPGWANWNGLGCDYNDTDIRQTADKLVSTGLRDAGYKILIIQECITKPGARGTDGAPQPDREKFPEGLKPLVDYIHKKGLLAGIYTDVGKLTCAKYEGSFDHEKIDALTFAKWGFDFIEVDACFLPKNHTHRELYARMRDGILNAHAVTGQKMILYMCTSGPASHKDVHIWGPHTGNLWRTTGDICAPGHADWNRMVGNFRGDVKYPLSQGPGMGWQDPDMLVVGMKGLTGMEWQTHFSMWAMVAAPLWIGVDLRAVDERAVDILKNKDIIAIDQDAKGLMASLVSKAGSVEVWIKRLQESDGEAVAAALLVVNFGNMPSPAITLPRSLFPNFREDLQLRCKDVVDGRSHSCDHGLVVKPLDSHGSILFRMSQVDESTTRHVSYRYKARALDIER